MTNEIIYRKAIINDVKKLSILYKQVYIKTYGIEGVSDEFANFITQQFSTERLGNLIEKNENSIIVAEYKNNLVGVAEIEFEKKCPVNNIIGPELNKLYILDWFCGKGIGKNLLHESEKVVLSKGTNQMWLWVLESNQRAINFYKKQHYITIGNAPFKMEQNTYQNFVMHKIL